MSDAFSQGYALLIGVGTCKYPDFSLPTTVKDTQAIAKILGDRNLCAYPEDNIKILNNQDATKSNILKGLEWLKEKAHSDRNSTILIYYSGHGWLNKDDDQYYLIPSDTKVRKMKESALPAKDFTKGIRKINSDRLLVMIDSCHAAEMATSKDLEIEFWDDFDDFLAQSPSKGITSALSEGKGRVVFTSSQGKEKSWVLKDQSLSIYTFHLLEALQGAGNQVGDTVVTVSNLMNYLGKTVAKTAMGEHSAPQHPNFDFNTEDFAIAMLRGGKGLPDKGLEQNKIEVTQNIYKIADNLTQIGENIITATNMNDIHIGDIIHNNIKAINQRHSGSGDNVAGDKNVTNNN